MTYGRARIGRHRFTVDGAAISHLAELVRGNFLDRERKAPSSAHRAGGAPSTRRAPSPQGEKGPHGHVGETDHTMMRAMITTIMAPTKAITTCSSHSLPRFNFQPAIWNTKPPTKAPIRPVIK